MSVAHAPLRLSALILVASTLGCTGPSPSTPGTAEPTAAPSATADEPTPSASVAAPAGPPRFEVHEWGLIDVAGTSARLLAGPRAPQTPQTPPRPLRKPVLYFHLESGTPSVDVSVKVTVPKPGVVEFFPTTAELTNSRSTLTWANVHVRKGVCHYQLPRDMAACNASDGCETAELPNYETEDAACLESGGNGYNLLFYRGVVSGALELPFTIADDGASVTITHAKGEDFIGPIVYVHHEGDDLNLAVLSAPEMGKSIKTTPPKEQDNVVAQRAIDQAMREVGLSTDEAAAFNRAWSMELYGLEQGRKVARRGKAERDVLLYAMPASMLDPIAKLEITPAPTRVKRFLLVRYEL